MKNPKSIDQPGDAARHVVERPVASQSRRDHLASLLRLAAVAPLAGAGLVRAQSTYPIKPVRIVVPYAVGGSTDTTARLVAQSLSTRLGQPFVVENRTGAGGSVGHDAVAKAAPDGYTLLFSAAGPLVVTPHIYAKLPYEPIKGFEPIKLVATAPLMLVVNPKVPATTVADLVRLAKARPGSLTYGSFGNGSSAHLAGELFKSLAGIDIVHVPYKGSAPALTDLLGGQIDMMFDVIVTSLPHVENRTLRALAVTSDKRAELLPNLPTMQQAGIKDFEAGTWFGLLAPAGTDRRIVDALSTALDATMQQKDFREILVKQGAMVAGGTPDDFRRFFLAEYEKWGKVVRAAGIKAD